VRRTTIVASEERLDRLQTAAPERGVCMAALIREAIEEKLERPRPKPRRPGIIDSAGATRGESS
jgi:hypothetical protein